jgi:hypothetical protein
MCYSVWGRNNDDFPNTIVEGHEPARYGNGSIDDDCQKKFYEIEAMTYEEAMAIFYLRQGWGPYNPGEPGECPLCDSVIYPDRTGKCWKCGNK